MIVPTEKMPPADKLVERKTADYEYGPSAVGYGSLWYYRYRRKPPFRRLWHVPAMMANPRVQIVMQTFEGAITSLTHFFIREENPAIKEYLIQQIERWWKVAASKMIWGALPYGFYGAEILYKLDNEGRLAFNGLASLLPQDVTPVLLKGEFVGLAIRNRTGSQSQAHTQEVRYLGGEKALWHVHMREIHPWWGQSRLYGAYEPWLDLTSEGGGLDVRRLYYYRNVLQSDVMYHPDLMVQDEQGEPVHSAFRARSLVEKMRAGGALVMPGTKDANGNRMWEIETIDRSGGGPEVLENLDHLKDDIAEGMGMSPEIFQAADTGSGFSGRKIPEAAWRGVLTGLVQAMVNDIDEMCFRKLVREVFGVEPSYEIIPFGIVRDEGDEGEDSQQPGPKASNRSVPKESVQMAAEGSLAV